jgi:hypothetical protein
LSRDAAPALTPVTHLNRKGWLYYLHGKTVTLQNGRRHELYYFAREVKPAEVMAAVPDGYRVEESPRTGRPFLKKVPAPD